MSKKKLVKKSAKREVIKNVVRRVAKPVKPPLTTDALMDLLYESVIDVKAGTSTPTQTNSVATGVRAMCGLVRLQMQADKMGISKKNLLR